MSRSAPQPAKAGLTQPEAVKSVARRISQLRAADRLISMDGSSQRDRLETLHKHAEDLYYEFRSIMLEMGWVR